MCGGLRFETGTGPKTWGASFRFLLNNPKLNGVAAGAPEQKPTLDSPI